MIKINSQNRNFNKNSSNTSDDKNHIILVFTQKMYTYNMVQVGRSFSKLSFFTYFEDGRSERRTP